MSPARRLRKAVHQRRQDLRRMIANRLVTELEAKYILAMYKAQKQYKSFADQRQISASVASTAPAHGDSNE